MKELLDLIAQLSPADKEILRRKWEINKGTEEEQDELATERYIERHLKESPLQQYTVWFNKDEADYGSINLRGSVPRVGERIAFRHLAYRGLDPKYDFSRELRHFVVTKVIWVVTVVGQPEMRLVHNDEVRAEVYVEAENE